MFELLDRLFPTKKAPGNSITVILLHHNKLFWSLIHENIPLSVWEWIIIHLDPRVCCIIKYFRLQTNRCIAGYKWWVSIISKCCNISMGKYWWCFWLKCGSIKTRIFLSQVLVYIITYEWHWLLVEKLIASGKQSITPNENVLHAPCLKLKGNSPTFVNAQFSTLAIWIIN